MKVIFNNGVEAPVSDVSSVYSLVIPTVDKAEVTNFKSLLTQENLKNIKIVNEDNEVTAEANNMVFQGISDPIDVDVTETNFMLREMTQSEVRIVTLEAEKELQAEAITELAIMVSGV